MTPANFQSYGWRIPFLVSVILVIISLYIRLRMKESPIFSQIKSTGMSSAQPLKDAFTHWPNFRLVLVSLLGATAGQGVVWYTGQYYALYTTPRPVPQCPLAAKPPDRKSTPLNSRHT